MNSDKTKVSHEFPPLYDQNSRVLILGSVPSPKSREMGFYYMHPQNRFWKMLCKAIDEPVPCDINGRKQMCLARNIALWDVLESCEICGASDASITNAVPNDLRIIIEECNIRAIFTTGKKAHQLYCKFFPDIGIEETCLPSTSPANRTISEEDMLLQYRRIAEHLR